MYYSGTFQNSDLNNFQINVSQRFISFVANWNEIIYCDIYANVF